MLWKQIPSHLLFCLRPSDFHAPFQEKKERERKEGKGAEGKFRGRGRGRERRKEAREGGARREERGKKRKKERMTTQKNMDPEMRQTLGVSPDLLGC